MSASVGDVGLGLYLGDVKQLVFLVLSGNGASHPNGLANRHHEDCGLGKGSHLRATPIALARWRRDPSRIGTGRVAAGRDHSLASGSARHPTRRRPVKKSVLHQ